MLKSLCHGTGSKLLHNLVYSYLFGYGNILSNYRFIRTAIQRDLLVVIQQKRCNRDFSEIVLIIFISTVLANRDKPLDLIKCVS